MASMGTVREWHDDEGWGVIDSPDTPGGCWAHVSSVEMAGYRHLTPGDSVTFDFERASQDGFAHRATTVTRSRSAATYEQPGFTSSLTLQIDVGDAEPVRVVRPHELTGADPTGGMSRELAFESGLLWAGRVTTAPGAVSGWHHHDRNVSSLYVVQGILRLEFEGVAGHLDAQAGDFVHVPSTRSTARATPPTSRRSR